LGQISKGISVDRLWLCSVRVRPFPSVFRPESFQLRRVR
jgi:hypothetical protein